MKLMDRLRTAFAAKPRSVDASAQVMAAATECVDALTLLHGLDWLRIELTFQRTGGRMAVTQSNVSTSPDAVRTTSALLALDPMLQTAAVSSTFERLHRALGEGSWDGAAATCARSQTGFDLTLTSSRGAARSLPTILMTWPLFEQGLFDELVEIEAATLDQQNRLAAELAGSTSRTWNQQSDPDHLCLAFADRDVLRVPCELLASYSRTADSWCWAWANSSFAPEIAAASRALVDSRPPLRLLAAPGFPCTEAFASTIASLAAHRLGALGVYPFTLDAKGVILYFAVQNTTPTPALTP